MGMTGISVKDGSLGDLGMEHLKKRLELREIAEIVDRVGGWLGGCRRNAAGKWDYSLGICF